MLILDEPASGLDPRARVEVKALLKELRRMGKTILISSHILGEVEAMCTSIGIIEAGKLVYAGTIQDVRSRLIDETGRIACAQVVLAGGAWSTHFARNAGISLPQLAVRSTSARPTA